MRRRIDVRHEPKEERAQIDGLVDVVRLREFVVVEDERGVGREELLRVVPERRAASRYWTKWRLVPVNVKPPTRRAVSAMRSMRSLDSAANERMISRVPSFDSDELDLERRHQVLERVLARVDAEPRDEAIDRRKEHEPLRAERDALGVEPEARRAQARLVERDPIERHASFSQTNFAFSVIGVAASAFEIGQFFFAASAIVPCQTAVLFRIMMTNPTAMDMSFDRISRVVRDPSGAITWDVPEGWRQGRGAFGGLTLATLARAASEEASAQGRELRTITAEIPSAVRATRTNVRVTTLRAGSGLTTIAGHLEQDDAVVAHAVMSFGKTRVKDFDRSEPIELPPFVDAPVVPIQFGGPEFAQHLEYRVIRGVPFASERDAVVEGWVRFLDPGEVPRSIALVALADAWFPSVLPTLAEMRPFATICFSAHLFDREWSLAEPLHHRARLVGSQDGYFVELRELFTPRGELCAINQQTFAVIR